MSCRIIVYPPCAVPACPEQIVYASENGNLNGIGVLDSNTSSLGTFRGVVGDGLYTSTSLDAGNKSIIVTIDPSAVLATFAYATEVAAGKIELATQAETDAGVDNARAVTPLHLATRTATETRAGVIPIATNAEITTGANDTKAVTSLKLATRLSTVKQTTVWANAAARNAAAPAFDGQIGTQLDTEQVFTATGLAAGNWQQGYLQPNSLTTLTADTTISLDGNAWIFLDGATEHIRIDSGTMSFGGDITLLAGANLNYATTAVTSINNVLVPANSLLGTSGTAGRMASRLVTDFLGSHSISSWAIPTGTEDRTTFDTATVTLPELAQRFLALLTDLSLLKIPNF